MIAIVVSRADSASVHVGDQLRELADWRVCQDDARADADGGGRFYRTDGFELRTFESLHLRLDNPETAFDDPDLLVFVSRHSGDTGPLLTSHFTGNFGPADYGGSPGSFARACPNAQAVVVDALDRHAPSGYAVGIECTHHGPSDVDVPSMFVELGSGEAQWSDPAGARAVARAVLDLRGVDADRDRQLVGLGGGHYAPRFERIVRETDWAVGHVGADWTLDAMGDPATNRAVVERAFAGSNAARAVVDGDRPDLVGVVEELGFRVVSETWVRETTGVDLDLVAAVEADLGTVDSGVRFGGLAAAGAEEYALISLPTALVDEARGVDAEATWRVVESACVAFETREGGSVPGGRAAVPDATAGDDIVESLTTLLTDKYDSVERVGDELVVTAIGFDPEKAQILGVPEGPAFGKLAAGEPVEVNGRLVDPQVVQSERVERIPLCAGSCQTDV